MREGFPWIAGLAGGLVLTVASGAFAAHHSKNNNNNNSNNNTAPAQPPPPAATQPAPQSQLTVDETSQKEAAAELTRDQQALTTISAADWVKFQQTPEWIAAEGKLESAQQDLDAAKKAATDNLSSNPDYQAALDAKKKAVADLEAAKSSGDATPETLAPLATASLQATLAIRKLESGVYTNDPGVQAATANLAAAEHDVELLKMKFQQQLANDKDYAAAKATVDGAQKRYDDAHAKVLADGSGS